MQGKASWVTLAQLSRNPGATEIRRCTSVPGVLSTTASAVLFGRVLSNAATSSTEWANYAVRYVEARVLAVRLNFLPFGTSSAAAPMDVVAGVIATDRSGALSTPTSWGQVWALADPRPFTDQMVKPFTYQAQAIDLEDQDYQPVGALGATFSVLYAVSAQVGNSACLFLATDFLVEFKGPQ